jgi:hypothetical protein
LTAEVSQVYDADANGQREKLLGAKKRQDAHVPTLGTASFARYRDAHRSVLVLAYEDPTAPTPVTSMVIVVQQES